MRLIKKSKSKKTPNTTDHSTISLFLKVNANRAADLIPSSLNSTVDDTKLPASSTSKRKSVNPVLVALLNKYRKKTSRKLNTNNPSWDDSILLPLKLNDYSQILNLTVWDKHKRYKNYLGEIRFNIHDIFYKDAEFSSSTDLKWHKLYSNKSYHSFVTGSLLLSFELVVKKKKAKSKRIHQHKKLNLPQSDYSENDETTGSGGGATNGNSTDSNNIVVNVVPPTRQPTGQLPPDLYTKLDGINMSDTEVIPVEISKGDQQANLKTWEDSLLYPDPGINVTRPDDQGFYSDSDDAISNMLGDFSDIDSFDQTSANNRSRSGSNASLKSREQEPIDLRRNKQALGSISQDDIGAEESGKSGKLLSVTPHDDESSSFSDASFMSSESAINSDMFSDRDKSNVKFPPKKNRKFKRKVNKETKFELTNRKVLGVIFLEIVSCTDLPPVKNATRTSFDMDPFVVVTFGKRTFRTSWKRHTLNPTFNERLAFEVLSHEKNFNIQFSVLDKDHFSFHDQVADISVLMKDLQAAATKSSDPDDVSGEGNGLESKENTPTPLIPKPTPRAGSPSTEGIKTKSSAVNIPFSSSLSNNASSVNSLDIDIDNMQSKGIHIVDNDNLVESMKKKKFSRRKKITVLHADTSNFKTMQLSLNLHNQKLVGQYSPVLKIRARFQPYDSLRRQFWKILLEQYNCNENEGQYDYIELISLLDALGSHNSDDISAKFFLKYGKSVWGGGTLTIEQITDCLEEHVFSATKSEDKIFEFDRCPLCCQKRLSKKDDIDIITHVAICASKDWSIVNKLLVSSYVSPQIATKRWFSKVLIKLTYGKYKLGGNSANILVQDRTTGIIMEEKMGVYVRLGIRLLYKGFDKAKTRRVRALLKKLSVKQGIKFDNPLLVEDIDSFIKFHKLDLSECLISDPTQFKSFNDFFYRKLKPGSRPNEAPNEKRVVVSPADCRCTAFDTVDKATELWIKGRNFTLPKLFNGNFNNLQESDLFKPDKCTLGIFRLAPQDYHRFHSPVEGKVKEIKFIEGEYYTVNPMAIRSDLDVFGENIRVLIAIETKDFGTVIMVAVGAMMVGSTILSVKVEDEIKRGDEVGYFKFGGSTIVLLFERKHFQFDSDLIENSNACVETLIRVGQSIGHHPDIEEYEKDHIEFGEQSKEFKINLIRAITGGDINDACALSNWESSNIKLSNDDIEELIKTSDDPGYADNDAGDSDASFDSFSSLQ